MGSNCMFVFLIVLLATDGWVEIDIALLKTWKVAPVDDDDDDDDDRAVAR